MKHSCSRAIYVVCLGLSVVYLGACSDGFELTIDTNDSRATKSEAVNRVVEANQKKALDNHHDHMATSTNLRAPGSSRIQTPAAPDYASKFDGTYRPIRMQQGRVTRNSSRNITARPPTLHSNSCVLDFSDPNLLHYENSGTTYWADRTYVPWLRDCGGNSRLDLRWSKYGHMHVGFTDATISFCFSEPDASPAHVDDQGNCDLLDINELERSYATSHGWDEVLVLRANYQYSSAWTPFDLKRIRVVRETGARVCYRKAGEPDSEGPWIISDSQGTGTSASMPGGWYCWKHLGQGHWDLSAWANDVISVKITSSTRTPSTFAIDDIHATVH
ncbi:MAG: hypothetical protein ACRBC3_24305 [Burkholderiaceae bacterium]